MSNETKTHEGEVLDQMPVAQQQTALVATDSPYLAMAQQALALGKVDQLDKLLDLQIRWDGEQARKAFVAAMVCFKSEPMEILKSKQVSFQTGKGRTEYKHAELSDVTDAVVPAMSRNGLSHAWGVRQEGGKITVTCTLTHAMGHRESVEIQAGADDSGGKNSIQAVASTISYLQRYTLLSITGMSTTGMDDDGRGHGKGKEEIAPALITFEQEATLNDLIESTGTNKHNFLRWLNIEKLSDLWDANYKIAFDMLNKKDRK